MTPDASQTLTAHLINQIRSSLAILEQLNVVQAPDADAIRSRLPPPNGPFPSLDTAFGQMTVTSPPPVLPQRTQTETRGRALWDYTGNDVDDLRFRAGDTLIVEEEVNDQWYRGRVIPQGEQYPRDHKGLFPATYIEKLPSQMVPYQLPGPPVPYQSPYAPQYQQQLQPAPPHIVVPEEKKPGKFGKIGSTLGHSAVGGLGFGAGSAIGGGLINKSWGRANGYAVF